MLSSIEYKALRYLMRKKMPVPENQLPKWLSFQRVEDLRQKGYVEFLTLCPPGKEPQFPVGLVAIRVTPSGEDQTSNYKNQRLNDRDSRQNARRSANAPVIAAYITGACAIIAALIAISRS